MRKHTRTTILRVSKHQKQFFYPVVVAFMLGCIVSWLTLTYFLIGVYLVDPIFVKWHKTIPLLLILATLLMFFVLFWTFRISNRYLGSYERLINDLDDVIGGHRSDELVTREGDVIFKELVKRINALIARKN